MPGMRGTDLALRLQAERPSLRVVFMSGYAPDQAFEGGIVPPGTTFLAKPFTAEVLAATIEEQLRAGTASAA